MNEILYLLVAIFCPFLAGVLAGLMWGDHVWRKNKTYRIDARGGADNG